MAHPVQDPLPRAEESPVIASQEGRQAGNTATAEESRMDRLVRLSVALMRLGVSEAQTQRLVAQHDPDEIEQQITWLKARAPKKPASLIVSAIREGYERPANYEEPPATIS